MVLLVMIRNALPSSDPSLKTPAPYPAELPLIVLGLAVNTGQALVYSQIVLSFGIPFALIPLLLITCNREVMGGLVNRRITSATMMVVTTIYALTNLVADILYAVVNPRIRLGGSMA